MKHLFIIPLYFLFSYQTGQAKPTKTPDYLKGCWQKQVRPLENKFLELNYHESENQLYHSAEPWQQLNTKTDGQIRLDESHFYQTDSLKGKKKTYYATTEYTHKALLVKDLGDTALSTVSQSMFLQQPIVMARYAPVFIIDLLKQHTTLDLAKSNDSFAVYKATLNKIQISAYIRKSDSLLVKITTVDFNDIYGDVMDVYTYSNFNKTAGLYYPQTIKIDKTNGKVTDEINIISASIIKTASASLIEPKNYKMEDKTPEKPEINTETYSDHIHFVNMKHTNDKVMIVEFKNFMLVAEAPLKSENGEMIIQEAKKIAPGKPIKYFAFSHFHPHYTGGMRPFVHKGATIISTAADVPYIQYLAHASHSLNPDSLEIQPHPLKTETINDSLTITDGTYTMNIYMIGKKSGHTNDYKVFYFPQEQMVFEGDLVWRKKDGPITKASEREAGLYHALKDLKIDIKTIIQSWPVNNYDVKTVIPFSEFEQSVLMEKKL